MAALDAHGRPQTVLLLGGNSGIGKAIVRRLVDEGTGTVLLAGRKPPTDLDDLAAAVEPLWYDATDTAGHRRFFDEVFARHRSIDLVIVAFGALHPPDDVELHVELAVEMAEVNYVGAVSALLHAARHMRRQGSGRLVVLSSVAGIAPRANFAYGSTKAGVDFLARGLAASLGDTAVEVLIVRPGFVRTPMTAHLKPVMFAVDPEAVADAVMDGLARHRRIVWVPAILRWVMAVVRALPPSMARRLG